MDEGGGVSVDAIITNELSKRFPDGTEALQAVNLRIPEGAAFACVGGENAGKTTLIRILSGLSRPSAGDCFVRGLSPFFEAEKLHAAVGTVLGSARFYDDLSLSENLRFFAALGGVDENDAIDRLSHLLHRLDIWEHRDGRVGELSTGVVVRAALARALMIRPKVLLVDEPDGGLDRETADHMQDLLSELVAQEGITVLLCTRNMEYAQQLCASFGILYRGQLLGAGDFESLRKRVGVQYRALLRIGAEDDPPRDFEFVDGPNGGAWQREIKDEDELSRIVAQAVRDGKSIYEARLVRPTLEEIAAALLQGGVRRGEDRDEGYDGDEAQSEA